MAISPIPVPLVVLYSDGMNQPAIYVHFIDMFQDEDCDFLAKLARLINCMGVQLIASWQK